MLLSICIPTYNRCEKVLGTLAFIVNELRDISPTDYELIVGDNCSTDETCVKVTDFLQKEGIGKIVRNKENLGLVGNVINLAYMATGDYLWFMGDDDVYYPGVVKRIVSEAKKHYPAFLFLNHSAYKERQKDNPKFASAVDLKKPSVYEDGYKAIVDIWNQTGTTLMFISSLVFRRAFLIEAMKENKEFNLASPLYYSFYVGAKGKTVIIKDVFVDDIIGNISWKPSMNDIFLRQIPRYLKNLPSYGYPKGIARGLFFKYLWLRKYWFAKDFVFRIIGKKY